MEVGCGSTLFFVQLHVCIMPKTALYAHEQCRSSHTAHKVPAPRYAFMAMLLIVPPIEAPLSFLDLDQKPNDP